MNNKLLKINCFCGNEIQVDSTNIPSDQKTLYITCSKCNSEKKCGNPNYVEKETSNNQNSLNKPFENKLLVEAMHKFRIENNKENSEIVIDLIKNSHFLCPVLIKGMINENGDSITTKEGIDKNTITLKEGTTMNFELLFNSKGEKYLMAFTDWNELRKWRNVKNQQTVILSFQDYCSMILKENSQLSGFVVNPYSHNISIRKDMIESWNKPIDTEYTVEKETTVQLGTPAEYPTQMINAMKEYMKKRSNIKEAYLRLMKKEDEKSFLIIVDYVGERKEVLGGIAKASVSYLPKGYFLDLVPVSDRLGQDAIKNVKPFYSNT